MNRDDLSVLAKATARLVREHLASVLPSLNQRIESLERQPGPAGADGKDGDSIVGPPGPAGRDGKDGESIVGPVGPAGRDGRDGKDGEVGPTGPAGKDADPAVIQAMVRDAVALIPAAKDGKPGRDGRDAEPIHPDTVELMVRRAVEAIPAARDGKDGAPGKDADIETLRTIVALEVGKVRESLNPAPPSPSVDMDSVRGLIAEEVRAAVALLPRPERGQPGEPGRDGRDGLTIPGPAGERGPAGEKGDNGERGERGERGLDGDIADLEIDIDPEDPRVFKVRIILSGDRIKEKTWRIPVSLHRGVFLAQTDYQKGDMVTHDGAQWHCQVDTTRAVPGKSPDWLLTVKRGQDGRPGKDGQKGERGEQGPPGQDLRFK